LILAALYQIVCSSYHIRSCVSMTPRSLLIHAPVIAVLNASTTLNSSQTPLIPTDVFKDSKVNATLVVERPRPAGPHPLHQPATSPTANASFKKHRHVVVLHNETFRVIGLRNDVETSLWLVLGISVLLACVLCTCGMVCFTSLMRDHYTQAASYENLPLITIRRGRR